MARQVLSFSGRPRLLIRLTCSWQHLLIDRAKAACNSQQVLDSSANVRGTSQHGISIVSARIAEMILDDLGAIIPIGSYQQEFG
jgi:hypothetical protein